MKTTVVRFVQLVRERFKVDREYERPRIVRTLYTDIHKPLSRRLKDGFRLLKQRGDMEE